MTLDSRIAECYRRLAGADYLLAIHLAQQILILELMREGKLPH